jgi:hypothetical protein
MKVIGLTTAAVLSLVLGIAAPVFGQEQQGEKQDHNNQQEHAQQGRPEQQHQDHNSQQQQRAQQQPRQDHNNQQTHAQQQQSQPNENKQSAQHPQQQQQRDRNNQQQHAEQHQQNHDQQHRVQQQQQQQQNHSNNRPQYAQQQRGNEQHHTQEQQRVQQSAWQQHRSGNWQSDHRSWQQRGGYRGYRIPDDRFRGSFGPDHGFRIYGQPFQVVGGYPRFQFSGYWFSVVDPWPEYWANNWYDTDDVYITYVDNGYYLYNRRYPSVGIAISISL